MKKIIIDEKKFDPQFWAIAVSKIVYLRIICSYLAYQGIGISRNNPNNYI